ncbi:CBS domain-containing protein [candidate division KSB1 bacterium]
MDVKAADIMVKSVVCVQKSTTLQELVEIFLTKNVSGVPVLDGEKLIGIISKTDMVTHGLEKELSSLLKQKHEKYSSIDLPDFDYLLGSEPSQETVEHVMTKKAITTGPDTKVAELVKIMLENKIHRVIIVEDEKVVGLVSTVDLLKLFDERYFK